jgi:hypothetical protein
MSKLEQVLALDPPSELRFRGPFTDVVTSYLKLTNPTDKRVCFKVKTTAPKRYCVRPNSGIVEPKDNVSVAVMLQPFTYDPNEKNKHKFMVQTMFAPDGEVNLETLWKDVNPDGLMDSKLKCMFELPADVPSQNNLDTSNLSNNERASKNIDALSKPSPKASNVEAELRKALEENKLLRDEVNLLRIDNVQLKEEGLRLRRTLPAGDSASGSGGPGSGKGTVDSLTAAMMSHQTANQMVTSPMLIFLVSALILGIIVGKIIL